MFQKIGKMIENVNNFIAINSVNTMATMWCVYSFAVLSLLPLIYPDSINIVQYISGAIIQLIALPLIMVGQDLLGRTAEARAIKDHNTIQKSFAEIKAMHAEHKEEMQKISEILKDVVALQTEITELKKDIEK